MERGYTGHEHLQGVELIHMNGRLYDPLLHRFLAPDNYVQDPYNTQNFNRYGYVYNNPLMYTDVTGEWFGIDDAIAFVIGGTVNLVVNAIQGNIDSWADGFAAFGAGGAAGTVALYGPAGWVAGGAIVGGTNAYLAGGDVGMGILTGAVSGLAGGAAGQWAAKSLGSVVINGTNIASPVLKGAVTGAIGGGAGGYVGGFTSGLITTGDIGQAHQMGMKGLTSGLALGGIIGGASGYAYAKANGLNPRTGQPVETETTVFRAVDANEANIIKNTGEFSLQDGGVEVKYFAKSLEDAHWYGQKLYPEGYSIIKGNVIGPINANQFWYPNIDIGAYVFPKTALPYIIPHYK